MTTTATSPLQLIIFMTDTNVPEIVHDSQHIVSQHRDYASLVHNFAHIKEAQLIIFNSYAPMSALDTFYVAYAMLQKKPVFFYGPPAFAPDCEPIFKEIITHRLNKCIIADLCMLDASDRAAITDFKTGAEVNYVLTNHVTTLLKGRLRALFRDALKNTTSTL